MAKRFHEQYYSIVFGFRQKLDELIEDNIVFEVDDVNNLTVRLDAVHRVLFEAVARQIGKVDDRCYCITTAVLTTRVNSTGITTIG